MPLSTEALKIIEQARLLSRNDFFFSATGRGPLAENVMSKYMKKINLMPARMDFALVYAIGLLKQPMPPMRSLKPF
ncbi:hypothetical protein predicted by Glimmer/Critica [Bartonella tribocorum CIP 105476]|uniref:Uncharacterized protein n=1 Tax=Bartonella tribocorum (strain DSM 28219 / CCUG 45778 / CIP 105476 / IBS 506) TaxID=382640 RepID=A9ITN8_BART1|nr:hypothetical protein predicted by Glimmer/Critica [Bartonella tribocorum CIP 105476]